MPDNINNHSCAKVPVGSGWTTAAWTRDRPPHLNDDNFPSSQVDALNKKPGEQYIPNDSGMEHVLEAMTLASGCPEDGYPHSTGTSTSDSTVTGYTIEDRTHDLLYYINNDPLEASHQQALTSEALQAFNNGHAHHGYQFDLATWRLQGYIFNTNNTKASGSMVMTKHPKSHFTEATLSSAWTIIPDVSYLERSGESVNGVGCRFQEIAAPPQVMDEKDFINVIYE